VALLGAELAATGLVTATGPAPKSAASNRYRLTATLPDDEFQSANAGVMTVSAASLPTALPDPAPFLQAEAQCEIDDPALRAWVQLAIAAAQQKSQDGLAECLRLLVRSHITDKDLSKGDASALETFRDRRGDCSEHANLLTAVLRIAGIPARTEVGVVYAASFGGWVGHAWNSAYCGDRWIHLDSAYPGIPRSCYLRMATSSGDDAVQTATAMMQSFTHLAGTTVEYLPE
jgi:transglutaminase-like putative cysteine protease